MLAALNSTFVVRVACTALLALAALFALRISEQAALGVWQAVGWATFAVNLAVVLLTVRPVFNLIHRATFAKYWWFPLLDGKWEGEANSNWPIVAAMLEAASRKGAVFNPLTDDTPPGADGAVTKLEATIASHLLNITIDVRVPGTGRSSHTLFVKPRWCRPDAPQFHYMYEQIDAGHPAATDTRRHHGAAILAYFHDDDELRGEYWTQRRGDRGLNTAGFIRLRRCNGK